MNELKEGFETIESKVERIDTGLGKALEALNLKMEAMVESLNSKVQLTLF